MYYSRYLHIKMEKKVAAMIVGTVLNENFNFGTRLQLITQSLKVTNYRFAGCLAT